ncbi:TerD family protein [Pseudofrankia sp. BMG5.37]|uniref:TerD family protein n=1 Tax=Pseudofrankia sp. BMG5.37 TaxID=3050035 RepID=UPI00289400B2|nr:TerD family protein [Pseudofrankia sp. BMG5.37]MDT3440543.1 TerD family protein [Pseudofrankia sp. BMG5.37]
MSVTLPKGGNVLLSAVAPGIERLRVALGWDVPPAGPAAGAAGFAATPELDGVVSVVSVSRGGAGESATSTEVLLAHQVPNPTEGPATPHAPPRTGARDVETIVVTLAAVPAEVGRLQIGAVIVDAPSRAQAFGSVRGAYIRVLNDADGVELARYDARAETGQETALVFGELYRHPAGWKFRAVGQGYAQGLAGFTDGDGHDPVPARPADVVGFLTRTSPTRSRRKVVDHLHPPRAAAGVARPGASPPPAGGQPAAPSRPAQRSPAPSRPPVTPRSPAAPTRPSPPGPTTPPRPPATPPRPPAAPSRPVPPAPMPPAPPAPPAPARPAARSPLDLSGDSHEPPARVAAPPPTAAASPTPGKPTGARSPLDLDDHDGAPAAPAAPRAGRSPLDLDADESPGAAPRHLAPPPAAPPGAVAPSTASPSTASPSTASPGTASPSTVSASAPARPADGAAGDAGRRPAGPALFGERSSRYRQRLEHVTELDDDHPATAWTAEKRGSGSMTITLTWAPLTTRTGLPRPSDLYLGCLWQALDGSAGVLQTLGGATSAPGRGAGRQVLALAPRDEHEGQKIFVDLRALETFKRFFVFAYGLRSAPQWNLLRGELTVGARTGEHLDIPLGDAPPTARTCVIASFHVAQDDLVIRRENAFFDGTQAEAAAHYGWALPWNPDGMTIRDR